MSLCSFCSFFKFHGCWYIVLLQLFFIQFQYVPLTMYFVYIYNVCEFMNLWMRFINAEVFDYFYVTFVCHRLFSSYSSTCYGFAFCFYFFKRNITCSIFDTIGFIGNMNQWRLNHANKIISKKKTLPMAPIHCVNSIFFPTFSVCLLLVYSAKFGCLLFPLYLLNIL